MMARGSWTLIDKHQHQVRQTVNALPIRPWSCSQRMVASEQREIRTYEAFHYTNL